MNLSLLWDILFPPCCAVCRKVLPGDLGACGDCLKKAALNSGLACGSCHSRLPTEKKHCHRDTPFLLCPAGDYSDDIFQALIKQLKFKGIRSAALPLGELMAGYLLSLPIDISDAVLVPVPLGKLRQRERGFNQAELLAQAVSRHTGLPVVIGAIIRTKETKPQSGRLDRKERAANVAQCFSTGPDSAALIGRTAILVDDVSTTGATLKEAAQALKATGAKKVYGLVAAKAS